MPRNPADRPATEPRTEGDPYKNRHPIRQWRLTDKVRQELDQIRSAGLSYDGIVADFDHAIRQERQAAVRLERYGAAIEAEAAQGAAPRCPHGVPDDDPCEPCEDHARRFTFPEGRIVGDRFVSDESFDAAIPAAPRAEGLDVPAIRGESDHALEALRHLFWIMERLDKQAGPPFAADGYVRVTSKTWLDLVRPAIRTVQSRLSRPSDERVPESEEPR